MDKKTQVFLVLFNLAIAGYFFAPAGVIPAIAAFFFVPGAAIVSRLAGGRLSRIESLGVSIVLSILVSAHFSYWFSIALGFSRETSAMIVALLCLPILLLQKETGSKKLFAARIKLPVETKGALAIAALLFLLLAAMYHNNFWVEKNGQVIVGGWNWSDLFVHLPVALTINNGNFPPQMPFYAGEKLVYHYFHDFHTAVIASYFGGTLGEVLEAMRWQNSLAPALFFLLCFALALRVVKNSKTALLAAVLIVFGGGFAYYNFFAQAASSGQNLLLLAGASPFDNDGKFFQIPSVIGGYLLVQRPQMVGLPALAGVLLLLCEWREHKKRGLLLLAGCVAGLLAPFQYFAFAVSLAAIAIFLLAEFYESKKIDLQGAALAYAPAIFSLPFALAAFTTTGRAGNIRPMLGWLAPHEPLQFVAFYFANLGLPFILAIVGLKYAKIKHKRELALLGALCFAFPNLVSLSGTVWDMAKFFTYLSIPVGILAASVLEDKGKLLVALALLLSVITPLQMIYWTALSNWSVMGDAELEAGAWMEGNTAQKSVFITSTTHISPVDAVAGRLRVVGYAGWMNNFGIPYKEREALLPKAFCGTAQEKNDAFGKLGAKYLYSGPGERRDYSCDHSLGLVKLFSNRETAVYSLP